MVQAQNMSKILTRVKKYFLDVQEVLTGPQASEGQMRNSLSALKYELDEAAMSSLKRYAGEEKQRFIVAVRTSLNTLSMIKKVYPAK